IPYLLLPSSSLFPYTTLFRSSGDLAPLAHVAACLIGEGEAWSDGRRVPARAALEKAGIAPLVLETKEGLALLNGTHLMAALGARSEEHTSELQSPYDLVCRLL